MKLNEQIPKAYDDLITGKSETKNPFDELIKYLKTHPNITLSTKLSYDDGDLMITIIMDNTMKIEYRHPKYLHDGGAIFSGIINYMHMKLFETLNQ